MTRSLVVLGMVGSYVLCASMGWAAWEQPYRTSADSKIHAYRSDAVTAGRVLLGIEGGILESPNDGKSWRRVLTVPASHAVRYLAQGHNGTDWWAASSKYIYHSEDGGRHWEAVSPFLDPDDPVQAFLCSENELYVGRSAGLEVSRDAGNTWASVRTLTGRSVHQIERGPNGRIWVSASDGVWVRTDRGDWRRVYSRIGTPRSERWEAEETDGEPEETPLAPGPAKTFFWFDAGGDVHVVDGLTSSVVNGTRLTSEPGPPLPGRVIAPPAPLYGRAAALIFEDGVRIADGTGVMRSRLTTGWSGEEFRGLTYEAAGDRLIAVTEVGVLRYEHPEIDGYLGMRLEGRSEQEKVRALLDGFKYEPGILELQDVASRYAEVHPDKILEWRRSAARRAWLPSVSFGADRGADETVDIDRGGTGDADRFIQGPDEKDSQWSVDLSWDLGDLIWSTDQTTIDNRSKLMVQLRDEILSQLNHLYYARRRLQVLAQIDGAPGLEKEIDRSLQIDEYTAGLDALTGGYFSRVTEGRAVDLRMRPEGR